MGSGYIPWVISLARELDFWLPRCQSAKPSYFCISKLGFIKECMLMNNIISAQFGILSDAIWGLIIQQRTDMVYILFGAKNIRLCRSNCVPWSVTLGAALKQPCLTNYCLRTWNQMFFTSSKLILKISIILLLTTQLCWCLNSNSHAYEVLILLSHCN